jgi:peptidoglycan-associated lipoprotein
MTRRPLSVLALALVLAMVACGKEPPPPPAPVGPTAAELEQARQDSTALVTAARDSAAAAAAARERAAQAQRDGVQRDLLAALEATVNFDYDEVAITPQAEGVLRPKADILRANSAVRITIQGHADERGSTEYNLALASRRADTVRQFFTAFGLDAGRFVTVSFGEERPLVNRSDEAAWAQNRRAEFVITGGGGELTAPR